MRLRAAHRLAADLLAIFGIDQRSMLLAYGVNVHPWPLAADGAITVGAGGDASFGIGSGSRFEVFVT